MPESRPSGKLASRQKSLTTWRCVFVLAAQAVEASRGNRVQYDGLASAPCQDQETGTHYNYFRDYDPATGRYGQSGPIGLRGGISTYAYSYNGPLRWSDPLGLAPRKLDPNSQECQAKVKQIKNIRDGIVKRQSDIMFNPQGLPLLPPYPGAPNAASVFGHQKIIDELRNMLQKRISEFNDKCGCDDDGGCPNAPPGTPAPSGGMSNSQKAAAGLGGALCVAACIAFAEICLPGLAIGGALSAP